ncbi:MAG: hypothetical protein MJZ45_02315 [Bacteroidales bacterium]|nr:hypothetical protein [Bacteroidales bacterium]
MAVVTCLFRFYCVGLVKKLRLVFAAVGGGGGDGRVLNSVKCDGGLLLVWGKCVFLQNEIRGVAGVAGSPLQPEEVWNLPIF